MEYKITNYMGDTTDPMEEQVNLTASGIKDLIDVLTDDRSNWEQMGDILKAVWDLKNQIVPALKAAQGRHKAEFGADVGLALTKVFLKKWADETPAA